METAGRLLILILVLAVIVVALRLRRGRRSDRVKITRRNPEIALVGIVVGSDSYDCEVVGESRYQRALETIAGGRGEDGARHKCHAVLRPEPDNPHDSNAVRVEVDGALVGYLPRGTAEEFTAEMNLLGYRLAVCNALVVGGWKATKKQKAGHFGILLDADIPFEFDEVDTPGAGGSGR